VRPQGLREINWAPAREVDPGSGYNPSVAGNASIGGAVSTASTMRVVGDARGTAPGVVDYSVWLLQVDDGGPYLAVGGSGPQLEIRSALTGELLPGQDLASRARTAIALHHARDVIVTSVQDQDGAWRAQAILAPGIAAHGDGETQQAAIDKCNEALDRLIDELRAKA
jgi:hypothetical protein